MENDIHLLKQLKHIYSIYTEHIAIQHMNRELPDVQADFRKGRGTRDQVTNICWINEKTTPKSD